MKYNNDNKRKQTRLLNKTTVALLAVGAAGAVYVLSPSQTSLEKKISDTNSPEVSLNYLQELERINPDDPMIPYLKAKLLYEKGNYNEVMELLDPEIKEDPDHSALDTFILYLKTRVAMADSIDNKSREQVIAETKAELDALKLSKSAISFLMLTGHMTISLKLKSLTIKHKTKSILWLCSLDTMTKLWKSEKIYI